MTKNINMIVRSLKDLQDRVESHIRFNTSSGHNHDGTNSRLILNTDLNQIPESYLIYKSGSTVKARNGSTGLIDYSGTDAKTVITSALTNLTVGRTWKEKVVVKGNFSIDNSVSALTIPDYTVFELQGKLTATTKTANLVLIGSNCNVYGGIYDGNRGVASDPGDTGVTVLGADGEVNLFVDNLTVLNGWARGFGLYTCDNINVNNLYVDNCDRNIMVWENVPELGTTRIANFNNIYSSNSVRNGFDVAINGMQVNNLVMDSCVYGLVPDSCRNLNINNVTSINCRGIEIVAGYADSYNITISNMRVLSNPTSYAIDLRSTGIYNIYNVNFINCHSYGSSDAAIYITKESTGDVYDILVDNCKVYDSGGYGIAIGGVTSCKISKCYIETSQKEGIYLNGIIKGNIVNNTLRNNVQDGGIEYAIRLFGSSTYSTITGNMIYDDQVTKTQYGLYEESGDYNIIKDNIIHTYKGANAIGITGANTIIKNNMGFKTENSGTATITAGNTYVDVAHGLSITPTYINIEATNEFGLNKYLSNIGATTFRINIQVPQLSDATFVWSKE